MRCARTLRISQSSASRKNHKSVGCADISSRNNRLFFKPMKRQLVSTMFNNQAYHVRGQLETKSTAFFTAGLDNRNWFKVNPDKKMDKWKRKELIRQRREYISFLLSSPYNRATKTTGVVLFFSAWSGLGELLFKFPCAISVAVLLR